MLHVVFLNVGQGDTTVICNLETREGIVVDCLDSAAVLSLLKTEGIRRLRAVVITHLHADHFSGVVSLLQSCERHGISWDALYYYWQNKKQDKIGWACDGDEHSRSGDGDFPTERREANPFRALASLARTVNKKCKSPHEISGLQMPGVVLEFLHPWWGDVPSLASAGKLNNLSTVLRVSSVLGASVLLTGDLEPEGWDVLVNNSSDLSSNVLKFPHHGAWNRGDVDAILDQVCPDIVVMSVGTVGCKYHHPNPHVLAALQSRTEITVLCTQATNLCADALEYVKKQVEQILASVPGELSGISVDTGSPCASTVLIELDNHARVVYPPQHIHRQIIEGFSSAQCLKNEPGA